MPRLPGAELPPLRWRGGVVRRLLLEDWGRDGRASRALAPLEILYRSALAVREAAYRWRWVVPVRPGVPVISVGNLAVGGTGKTPLAGWLVDELVARGMRPAVLHGGYGSDEPALHRHWHPDVPVYVDRERAHAAARAESAGAEVLVLDDGFQHRRLARDLDLVLVSADAWRDGWHLLPRGPWREGPSALARADAIVVTRKTADAETASRVAAVLRVHSRDRPIIQAAIEAGGWRHAGEAITEGPGAAIGVAAVADPWSFAKAAAAAGADLSELLVYPDHHAYSAGDASSIARAAGGRPVVTTEKDWVKLRVHTDLRLWVLTQRVCVEEGRAELAAVLDGIARMHARK